MPVAKISNAFAYAEALHREQTRKGANTPYLSHLMSVSALVLEHGGDENQAIAALLHDAVEDQGGLATLREIRTRFGPEVAQLVLSCSDSIEWEGAPKRPWRERKLAYVEKLAGISSDAALIITCDKIHNISCLIADVRRHGVTTLHRFRRPASLRWYYSAVAAGLWPHRAHAPVARLQSLVSEFAALVADAHLPEGCADD